MWFAISRYPFDIFCWASLIVWRQAQQFDPFEKALCPSSRVFLCKKRSFGRCQFSTWVPPMIFPLKSLGWTISGFIQSSDVSVMVAPSCSAWGCPKLGKGPRHDVGRETRQKRNNCCWLGAHFEHRYGLGQRRSFVVVVLRRSPVSHISGSFHLRSQANDI